MSYISKILERANIQQIIAFLMSGAEYTPISDETYTQRLDNATKPLYNYLEKLNIPELDELLDEATFVSDDVHMEIGMICGFKIAMELIGKLE